MLHAEPSNQTSHMDNIGLKVCNLAAFNPLIPEVKRDRCYESAMNPPTKWEYAHLMKFLYHANCTDGYGAALAAWMKHGDEGHEYIPVQYGSPVPDGLADEDVYILDFSYKRDVLLALAEKAHSVTILDHHKTAQEDLSGTLASNIDVTFDMARSGAVIAWEHFHDTPIPQLLLHIQDRDLWEFKLDNTNEIIKGLRLIKAWRTWPRFFEDFKGLDDLALSGAAVNLFLLQQSEDIVKAPPRAWDVTGATIPVYNLPGFMMSDTLSMALDKYPDAPYAVGFTYIEDAVLYSLRSRRGSDVDVSVIAAQFGGGGHKHAAGFSVGKSK